jgi:hypothetical protein
MYDYDDWFTLKKTDDIWIQIYNESKNGRSCKSILNLTQNCLQRERWNKTGISGGNR